MKHDHERDHEYELCMEKLFYTIYDKMMKWKDVKYTYTMIPYNSDKFLTHKPQGNDTGAVWCTVIIYHQRSNRTWKSMSLSNAVVVKIYIDIDP